jgi:hypothetical protein
MTERRVQAARGYILLEVTVALILLSVGAYAIHSAFQQAAMARGQAEDYTRVRFLLEQVLGDLDAKPVLEEGAANGVFDEPNGRFRWSWRIQKVMLPLLRPEGHPTAKPFRYPIGLDFVVHVEATVEWERGGQTFSESMETLLGPERLWEPPRDA